MVKHLSTFKTTLVRDITLLCSRLSLWRLLAIWAALSAMIFFAYLEDFLGIQSSLRAKNFRYGVTDIVLLPYLKLQVIVAMLIMSSLCSRLFYLEKFTAFSALFRSTQPNSLAVVTAKTTTAIVIAIILLLVATLPMIVSGFFFEYNVFRLVITLFSCFMVLLSVGVLAIVLSQVFAHSILVMLTTVIVLTIPEIAVRLFVEPAWLTPILIFFSPLAHVNRIATGVVTASDAIFFGLFILLLFGIAVRQFNNTYLTTS